MLCNLLLIKARVDNLLFKLFGQALKLPSFLVHHYSVFPFGLILQLQLRGITSLFDDGAELALLNGDNIRWPLFLFLTIPIIFRLFALVSHCFLGDSLFTAALDNLGELKNDI